MKLTRNHTLEDINIAIGTIYHVEKRGKAYDLLKWVEHDHLANGGQFEVIAVYFSKKDLTADLNEIARNES